MPLLLPAYFVGACAMLLLAVLQDRVMPEAHYASRHVDESVFLNVEQILKRKDRQIQEKSFVFKWGGVTEDDTGSLILDDIELVQFRDKNRAASWSRAKSARPVIEAGSSARDSRARRRPPGGLAGLRSGSERLRFRSTCRR